MKPNELLRHATIWMFSLLLIFPLALHANGSTSNLLISVKQGGRHLLRPVQLHVYKIDSKSHAPQLIFSSPLHATVIKVSSGRYKIVVNDHGRSKSRVVDVLDYEDQDVTISLD